MSRKVDLLICYNGRPLEILLPEGSVSIGDNIEVVVSSNNAVTLKYVVNNTSFLYVDLKPVAKYLLQEFADDDFLRMASVSRFPLKKISISVKNVSKNKYIQQAKEYSIIEGSATINNPLTIENNRFAPIDSKVTLFKGYPQIDSYLVYANNTYNSRNVYRDSDEPIENIGFKKPSDIIHRIVDECGLFLRWKNGFGGWSYWLFDEVYTEEIKTKSLGLVSVPYRLFSSENRRLYHLGFTSNKQWHLKSKIPVLIDELEELKTLLTSPDVFLFNGKKGAPVKEQTSPTEWIRVAVSQGTHKIEMNAHAASNFEVSIEFFEEPTVTKI